MSTAKSLNSKNAGRPFGVLRQMVRILHFTGKDESVRASVEGLLGIADVIPLRYLDAAERTLKALSGEIERLPSGHNALLTALEETLRPPQTIVLRGDVAAMQAWQERCQRYYAPRRLLLAIPATATHLPGVLAQRLANDGVTAYVCSGHACSAPIHTLTGLDTVLKEQEARPTP